MRIPRPIVAVHGEDVDLEIPGLLTMRASYLSEGLFDVEAGGDPEEEDLYEVEVTHARDALLQPLVFARLSQASPKGFLDELDNLDPMELDDEEVGPVAELPIERFVKALAWELANAHPSNWDAICQRARVWGSWSVEEVLTLLPSDWTPEPLLPDEE